MKIFSKNAILLAGISLAALSAGIGEQAYAQGSTNTGAGAASDNDVVVVTARRKALQTATDRKKNSDTVIDSIVADEAGKLPDNSVTEVLQRVSGVSIVRYGALNDPDHFSAEGSGIQVRGLTGVAGFLNGREVFSANGGQGLLWGDVTPELMSAVDVYKSSTADRLVGGTGGAIDLRTKMPFDYKKPSFQATLGGSYGDLADKWTPEGSFLVTNRWHTPVGEIGALVDLAYSKYSAHDNFFRMEPFYQVQVQGKERYIPGGFDYGSDDFNRERTGVYAAFQWRPSDDLTFFTTMFSSKYVSDNTESGQFITSKNLTVDPSGTSVFDSSGALISATKLITFNTTTGAIDGSNLTPGGNTGLTKGSHITNDWSTGFDWRPNDRTKVSGAVQFVDSSSEVVTYSIFPQVDFPGSFSLDLSGNLPMVSVPASGLAIFSDPHRYVITADMPHIESNHGTMSAANLDADFVLSDSDWLRSIKIGGRYASRVERDAVSGYNWNAVCVGWNGCDISPTGGHTFADAKNKDDIELRAYENFFRGEINLPANLMMPSRSFVAKLDPKYVRAQFGIGGDNPIAPLPTDYSHGTTETVELYAMARFGGDSLFGAPYTGNFGVRAVQVKSYRNGFIAAPAGFRFNKGGVIYQTAASAVVADGGTETTRILPSFNLSVSPSDKLKLRFAYTTTMDLPSFTNSRANGTSGVVTHTDPSCTACAPIFDYFSGNVGNPRLKPVFSDNFDFSAEWYKSNSLNAHFSLFHKSLTNAFIFGQTRKKVPFTYTLPTATTVLEDVEADEYFNAPEKAKIDGFEVGIRQFFDFLPAPFDGIGYEANYTHLTSKNPGDLALAIDNVRTNVAVAPGFKDSHELRNNPVSALSPETLNLVAMYEKGPWSARIAYNWRSRYLMSTNANGTNGDYTYYDFAHNTTQARKINLPVYSTAYGQIDVGASYKVNEHISVNLEASNVTDVNAKTLQGGYPNGDLLPRSYFVTDKRVNLSLRLNY